MATQRGRLVRAPRVFPLHFPGCKPGHVHVSLAGRGTGENTTTYDRLERCPRRVVVQDAELFRDGVLVQVRVDRNARQKAELHVLDVVVGVEADDRLDERIGSTLSISP